MVTKKAQHAIFYAIILGSVALSGFFTQYAFSALTNTYVITSSGQITNTVYAASGSASDIQAAVNLISSSGGTVHVPAGTFYWNGQTVNIPGGVNVIGASPAGCKGHEDNWESYTATTILHTTRSEGSMFLIGSQTHGVTTNSPSRVSGIQFEADEPANPTAEAAVAVVAIEMWQIPDFRIDHCTFINFAISIGTTANDGHGAVNVSCYGVVDHCVFDLPYKQTPDSWVWGYGVYTMGNGHDEWQSNIEDFRGHYGWVKGGAITYIEDCHFSRLRHNMDAMHNGYYVARYNLIDNPSCVYTAGMVNDHGAAFVVSARGYEAYSNTLIGLPASVTWQTPHNDAFTVRGGSAIITGNSYIDDAYDVYSHFLFLSTQDDVAGREEQGVSSTYVWGNSYENCVFSSIASGITENVDYFLRAPNLLNDGFTYVPYVYPHPLTLEATP